jgi:hypothetical protein
VDGPYLNRGVIAGRINYRDGTPVEDAQVSLYQQDRLIDTTTTYIHVKRKGMSKWNVNSDDVWGENFVFGDVPAGDYQVVVNVGGVRITKDVGVRPATTAFIDLGQAPSGPSSSSSSSSSGSDTSPTPIIAPTTKP